MKLVRLSKLFNVKYGVNLELNKLTQDSNGINFVSRTAKNNGVSAKVQLINGIDPIQKGTISVAGGGSVMESFLQTEPYYSGRDLYYLTPLIKFTDQEKLFYCVCLRANQYRFNYGRQANRTLKNLLVPDVTEIPKWVNSIDIHRFDKANLPFTKSVTPKIDIKNWQWFEYQELFDIERGKGPRKKDLDGQGTTPVVTSSDSNNGWTAVTNTTPMHNGNTIGVNRNGSIAEAFYQPVSFCSTEDVHIFSPKFQMNQYIGLFIATLIKREKYRYNYGRKWGIARMKVSKIKLPVTKDGKPDFNFMEKYIKTLPFSKGI